MCITRRKPVPWIDYFKKDRAKHAYHDPGVAVDTNKAVIPRIRTRSVPEHPLEKERFRRTEFVYEPSFGLPDMGWIQNCLFCDSPTTMIYAVNKHKGYCCGKCQRKFSREDKEYVIRSVATSRS